MKGYYFEKQNTEKMPSQNRTYNDSLSRAKRRTMRLYRSENLHRSMFEPIVTCRVMPGEDIEQKKGDNKIEKLGQQGQTRRLKQKRRGQHFLKEKNIKIAQLPTITKTAVLLTHRTDDRKHKQQLSLIQKTHQPFVAVRDFPKQKQFPQLVNPNTYTAIFTHSRKAIQYIRKIIDWNTLMFRCVKKKGMEEGTRRSMRFSRDHSWDSTSLQSSIHGEKTATSSQCDCAYNGDEIFAKTAENKNENHYKWNAVKSNMRLDIAESMHNIRATKRILSKELRRLSSFLRAVVISSSSNEYSGIIGSKVKHDSTFLNPLGYPGDNFLFIHQLKCAELSLQRKQREADRLLDELRGCLNKILIGNRFHTKREEMEEQDEGNRSINERNRIIRGKKNAEPDHRSLASKKESAIGIGKHPSNFFDNQKDSSTSSDRLFPPQHTAIGGLDALRWRRRQRKCSLVNMNRDNSKIDYAL